MDKRFTAKPTTPRMFNGDKVAWRGEGKYFFDFTSATYRKLANPKAQKAARKFGYKLFTLTMNNTYSEQIILQFDDTPANVDACANALDDLKAMHPTKIISMRFAEREGADVVEIVEKLP